MSAEVGMSEDWNIYCCTCKETYSFDDANHKEKFMWLLIDHAPAIAGLAPLFADQGIEDLTFGCYYGRIEPEWFQEHLGHELVPISEYGNFGER